MGSTVPCGDNAICISVYLTTGLHAYTVFETIYKRIGGGFASYSGALLCK